MSAEEGPSRKRIRVDNDDEAHLLAPPIQKDADIWLSDGSIVVVADNVAFRVHQSTLALRSEIFRDMFSLPNIHSDTAEMIEECPTVRVSDTPEDIRHLFLVLCCGKNYYYNRDTLIPVPFDVLDSLIRMAHKYAIQDVLDDALSRLMKYYPTDLAIWQDADSRARYVTAKDANALTVIELARLTNTPSLLPTAFLTCTRLATGFWPKRLTSVIASLGALDQARVIAAKASLAQGCAARPLYLLSAVPCASCTTRGACRMAREAPLDALRNGDGPVYGLFSDADALKPIAERFWGDAHWRRFCVSCKNVLLKTDEVLVMDLWNDLPTYFDVKMDQGSWPSSNPVEMG